MTTDADEGETTILSPDEAFATLGNETRMEILRTLGDASDPLSFSELRDRVGMRDSGQFNYHLDKLVGHFVEDTGDGYQLQRAGERIIEAVLSGAITESPEMDLTQIDISCHLCGAPIEVSYQQERLAASCTECAGHYDVSHADQLPTEQRGKGFLAARPLPPAGVKDRTPLGVVQAANTWWGTAQLAMSRGICPRCSAPIDMSTSACENHDTSGGLCQECDRRHAVGFSASCTNCIYTGGGMAMVALRANTDLQAFLLSHGVEPVYASPTAEDFSKSMDYDEEILSTDPVRARFTWTIDGDSLMLTVDDELNVVEVRKGQGSDTG